MIRPVRAALAALAALALAGCAFTDPLIDPSDRVADQDGFYFVGESDGAPTAVVFELTRVHRPRDFGSPYVRYEQRGLVSENGVWTRLYSERWSEWEADPKTPATDLLDVVYAGDKSVDLYFRDEEAGAELRLRSEPLAEWTAPEDSGGGRATMLSGAATVRYKGRKIDGRLLATRLHGIEETFGGFEATAIWDRRGNWWLATAPGFLGRSGRLVAFSNSRGQTIAAEGAELSAEPAEAGAEEARTLKIAIPSLDFRARLAEKEPFRDEESSLGLGTAASVGRAEFRGRERRVFGLRQSADPEKP